MDNRWYLAQWCIKYRGRTQEQANEFAEWAVQNSKESDPEWLIWENWQTHRWTLLYGGRDKY